MKCRICGSTHAEWRYFMTDTVSKPGPSLWLDYVCFGCWWWGQRRVGMERLWDLLVRQDNAAAKKA